MPGKPDTYVRMPGVREYQMCLMMCQMCLVCHMWLVCLLASALLRAGCWKPTSAMLCYAYAYAYAYADADADRGSKEGKAIHKAHNGRNTTRKGTIITKAAAGKRYGACNVGAQEAIYGKQVILKYQRAHAVPGIAHVVMWVLDMPDEIAMEDATR